MVAVAPMQPSAPIREVDTRDGARVREVLEGAEPVVLRGLVAAWPAVAAARGSADGLLGYLRRFDSGAPVDAIMTPPEFAGRIFYRDGLEGFNFVRNRLPLTAVAEQALRYGGHAQAPAVAVQSAPVDECLPGFAQANPLPAADISARPRIWLGNAVTTPTHLDEWFNIGCVVAGRRRFTLFPPEQISNLYVGPLDYAPTGAPMSLVQLHAPDFVRFPKFTEALAASCSAELSAGDALFIPPLWWHNVESLETLNVLINYWWHASGAPLGSDSGYDSLKHAILNIRPLPAGARAAWRALFEHYVFGEPQETISHIPPHRRGLLGELTPADAARLREQIAQRLKNRKG
ncbi:MAG TPA: cupin-like domain-containing protein [Steroidobacteraceae bacterium]|nr:cupin-like domain-containing protein [Steroidobacteraceae bacterium]